MLYISATQSSEVIVTLAEKSSNQVNPYYTWKLLNVFTNGETVFYQTDHSDYPYYYNSFTLSVATISGLTAGIIDVIPGEYQYFVYEMTTPYDLDLDNSIGLVENGILYVVGDEYDYTGITFSGSVNKGNTFSGYRIPGLNY